MNYGHAMLHGACTERVRSVYGACTERVRSVQRTRHLARLWTTGHPSAPIIILNGIPTSVEQPCNARWNSVFKASLDGAGIDQRPDDLLRGGSDGQI